MLLVIAHQTEHIGSCSLVSLDQAAHHLVLLNQMNSGDYAPELAHWQLLLFGEPAVDEAAHHAQDEL